MMTKPQTIYDISGDILYEGKHDSFCECLENAVSQGIRLDKANLRYATLTNAALDEAQLNYADFTGANLTAANLSASDLKHSVFCNTDLYNCCLAESALQHSDFSYARFGGTIISQSDISFCRFNSLSALDLNFTTVCKMVNCQFYLLNHNYNISEPPIIVKGFHENYLIHNPLTKKKIHQVILRNQTHKRRLV